MPSLREFVISLSHRKLSKFSCLENIPETFVFSIKIDVPEAVPEMPSFGQLEAITETMSFSNSFENCGKIGFGHSFGQPPRDPK
jgi:hypothetical protein